MNMEAYVNNIKLMIGQGFASATKDVRIQIV